jgi:hypothetical protein
MRYICLVHADPQRFESFTREQRQDIDRRSLAYNRELTEKGHYLAAEAIQDGSSAILVRVRNGAVSTTDGPFIETKEQMAGFILIEAQDMNDALRLAAGIPMAELGTIEVRSVREVPAPP